MNKTELIAYIGNDKKSEAFRKLFEKYEKNPRALVFWLPAFLFGFWYLWYRKLFLEGAVWFALVWLIPLNFFAKFLISTLIGSFLIPLILYYKYKKTKNEIEKNTKNKEAKIVLLKEKGGITKVPIFISSLCFALIFFTFLQFKTLIIGMLSVKTPSDQTEVILNYTEENFQKIPVDKRSKLKNQLTLIFTEIKNKKISNKEGEEKIRNIILELWEAPKKIEKKK
ncbi:MAG: hypothetical protein ACTSXL_01100 [Alphaproteobacteria bacterium]